MLVTESSLHRVKQTIDWRGMLFSFFRKENNVYGENSGEPIKIAEIKGFYHNGSSNHIAINTSDAGMVIDKNTPYIMALWEDSKDLKTEDLVEFNGKQYKVSGVNNISELNIIAEISLEKIL